MLIVLKNFATSGLAAYEILKDIPTDRHLIID